MNFTRPRTHLVKFVRTFLYTGAVHRTCTYKLQISLARSFFELREREREREEILYVQPRCTGPVYSFVRTIFQGDIFGVR